MSLGLLPQARFILTYVNLLASSSVNNPSSVSQLINSGCLALCQTVLRLAGPDESKYLPVESKWLAVSVDPLSSVIRILMVNG